PAFLLAGYKRIRAADEVLGPLRLPVRRAALDQHLRLGITLADQDLAAPERQRGGRSQQRKYDGERQPGETNGLHGRIRHGAPPARTGRGRPYYRPSPRRRSGSWR